MAETKHKRLGARLDNDPSIIATTREVFETGDNTVIKRPQMDGQFDGFGPNKREVEHWKKLRDATMLAPICDYADDYSWIEMAKVRRLERGRDDSLLTHFREKMKRHPDFDISDLHTDNVGVLPWNGHVVCIDYADMTFY